MTANGSLFDEGLRPGQAWSRRMRRNQVLRLTDLEGTACVAAMFFNARDLLERYNMPDTLKAQYTAFLTKGRVEVTLRDVRNPEDVVKLTLGPGEGVVIPPLVCRTFHYAEDGEAISARDIPHSETGPDIPFEAL